MKKFLLDFFTTHFLHKRYTYELAYDARLKGRTGKGFFFLQGGFFWCSVSGLIEREIENLSKNTFLMFS